MRICGIKSFFNSIFPDRKERNNLTTSNDSCDCVENRTDKYHNVGRNKLVEYWYEENILQETRGYFKIASAIKLEEKFRNYSLDNKNVLDVGCGLGEQLLYFKSRNANVFGVDLNHRTNVIAKRNNLPIVTTDARYLSFKNESFDVIYSLGVLEHFYDTEKAIKEQIRLLRPGGLIIIVVPYLFTPLAIAITLFEIFRGAALKYGFTVTRGKLFSKKVLGNMLINLGCVKINIEPYYGAAILRALPFNIRNRKFIFNIEKSIFSRKLGLVLYAEAFKNKG